MVMFVIKKMGDSCGSTNKKQWNTPAVIGRRHKSNMIFNMQLLRYTLMLHWFMMNWFEFKTSKKIKKKHHDSVQGQENEWKSIGEVFTWNKNSIQCILKLCKNSLYRVQAWIIMNVGFSSEECLVGHSKVVGVWEILCGIVPHIAWAFTVPATCPHPVPIPTPQPAKACGRFWNVR